MTLAAAAVEAVTQSATHGSCSRSRSEVGRSRWRLVRALCGPSTRRAALVARGEVFGGPRAGGGSAASAVGAAPSLRGQAAFSVSRWRGSAGALLSRPLPSIRRGRGKIAHVMVSVGLPNNIGQQHGPQDVGLKNVRDLRKSLGSFRTSREIDNTYQQHAIVPKKTTSLRPDSRCG